MIFDVIAALFFVGALFNGYKNGLLTTILRTAFFIAGGVAANSRLRHLATERCERAKIALAIPEPALCTDNGAMVASLAALMIAAGRPASPLAFDATSSMDVESVSL